AAGQARRVGPRDRPDPPRHAAQSKRGPRHAVRALGESHAPRILRARLPDGAPVPGRHLLLEAADAGVQPRPPRTPGGGEARSSGVAAAQAQFPEPRPGPDRALPEVPRPRSVRRGGPRKGRAQARLKRVSSPGLLQASPFSRENEKMLRKTIWSAATAVAATMLVAGAALAQTQAAPAAQDPAKARAEAD